MPIKVRYKKMLYAMHDDPNCFSGFSALPHAQSITELVEAVQPKALLDYGCGKGKQYTEKKLHDTWGGLMPVLYDPGYIPLRVRPTGLFNGVICTDVLEHLNERDVPMVLDDICSYIEPEGPSFLFLSICCRPAKKTLPDGRNAHLTIKSPVWWQEHVNKLSRVDLRIRTVYT